LTAPARLAPHRVSLIVGSLIAMPIRQRKSTG
jgi:hypothetical protein